MEYYKISLLLNAVDSAGLLSWSSTNYEFQKPRFLVGYSLWGAYSDGPMPDFQHNLEELRGTLTIDQPREAPFALTTASITTNAQTFQNIFNPNGNQTILFPGQFQIAPLEIRIFRAFISGSDIAAVAKKIDINLHLWFMTLEEYNLQ